jgi:hypothetical protein
MYPFPWKYCYLPPPLHLLFEGDEAARVKGTHLHDVEERRAFRESNLLLVQDPPPPFYTLSQQCKLAVFILGKGYKKGQTHWIEHTFAPTS